MYGGNLDITQFLVEDGLEIYKTVVGPIDNTYTSSGAATPANPS